MALCDDIIDYNKKMESYIEKYGNENHVEVKITSYGSGSQLLLNYQKRKFDVIFLDVSMPEMDGFTTTRQIRKLAAPHGNIPIIALTADAMQGDREKCLEAGMNDYVTKPFRIEEIEEVLKKRMLLV